MAKAMISGLALLAYPVLALGASLTLRFPIVLPKGRGFTRWELGALGFSVVGHGAFYLGVRNLGYAGSLAMLFYVLATPVIIASVARTARPILIGWLSTLSLSLAITISFLWTRPWINDLPSSTQFPEFPDPPSKWPWVFGQIAVYFVFIGVAALVVCIPLQIRARRELRGRNPSGV